MASSLPRRHFIAPEHPSQPRPATHRAITACQSERPTLPVRHPMPDPRVRPLGVVVLKVLAGKVIEMATAHHDEPAQAFVLQCLDEPLGVDVEVGRAVGQADGRHARFPQRPIEGFPELRVAVAGEDAAAAQSSRLLQAWPPVGYSLGVEAIRA